MRPTANYPDLLRQFMVALVAVCVQPAVETIEERFRILRFSVRLVIVENDRMCRVPTRLVQSNVALAGSRFPVFLEYL